MKALAILAALALVGGPAAAEKPRYSFDEIEWMREVVIALSMTCDTTRFGYDCVSQSPAETEAELRTYMANGTTPEELEVALAAKNKSFPAWTRAFDTLEAKRRRAKYRDGVEPIIEDVAPCVEGAVPGGENWCYESRPGG